MSDIKIHYPLDCHIDHSKDTVQSLLDALEDKYAIKHQFIDEHTCQLKGSSVSGSLVLLEDSIEIMVKLGFMMLPFKSIIENELINKLNEKFANAH